MALTRITKGVIKPNENYDTHNINSTGIVTAIGLDVNGNGDISGNLSVGGVLTYEDVTSIDSVGIITAQKDIHVGAGVSAVGVGTFGSLDIGGDIDVDGHTNLDNVSISGIVTATTIRSSNLTSGRLVFTSTGGQLEASGNLTYNGTTLVSGSPFDINADLDVDGHTNLDNVNIAGVTTITGSGSSVLFLESSNPMIRLTDTDNNAYSSIGGESGFLYLYTNSSSRDVIFRGSQEVARITGDGLLGIGTVNPTAPIHLHKASGDVIQKIESSNGAAALELRHTNGYGYINYRQDGAETFRVGQIAQFTSYSVYNPNSSLPYQFCVEGNGEVGINTHNPVGTLHLLRNSANHGITLQRGGTNAGTAYVQVHSNGVLSLQGGNNIHYVSGGSQQHIWYRAGTEIARFNTTGSLGIGTATIRNNRTVQITGASQSNLLITGHAPSVCLNSDPDDSTDSDRTFLGQAAGSNNFANGTAAGDTILRGTTSGRIVFGIGTNVKMNLTSAGDLNIGSVGRFDANGLVKTAHGTESAPSHTFLNDPDNGMYRPTTNTLGFVTGGSEKVRITSSGHVGIGTDNPVGGSYLHIQGGGSSDKPHIRILADRGLVARLGDTSGGAQAMFDLYDTDGSTQIVRFISGGGDNFINTGGNFGVGTNSPNSIIHATGSNSSTGYYFKNTHTTSGFGMRIEGGGTTADRYSLAVFNAAGNEKFRVNANGNIGVNEPSPQRYFHATGNASTGCAHFGVFGTNAGNSYVGNTPVVTISTDGNGNAGTNDEKAIFQVGRGGGGAGAAAVTTEHFRVTLGGTTQIGGVVGSNSDIDLHNTKLTIKQSANNREDGIYIERVGERRGWLMFVGGSGNYSDAFCLSTNQLGSKTDVLAIDRGNRLAKLGGDVVIDSTNNGYGGLRIYDDTSGGYNVNYVGGRSDGNMCHKFFMGGRSQNQTPWVDATGSEIMRISLSNGLQLQGDTDSALQFHTGDHYKFKTKGRERVHLDNRGVFTAPKLSTKALIFSPVTSKWGSQRTVSNFVMQFYTGASGATYHFMRMISQPDWGYDDVQITQYRYQYNPSGSDHQVRRYYTYYGGHNVQIVRYNQGGSGTGTGDDNYITKRTDFGPGGSMTVHQASNGGYYRDAYGSDYAISLGAYYGVVLEIKITATVGIYDTGDYPTAYDFYPANYGGQATQTNANNWGGPRGVWFNTTANGTGSGTAPVISTKNSDRGWSTGANFLDTSA